VKLKPKDQLPDQQLRLTVPGAVMHKLELYRTYRHEAKGETWNVRELATEVLRAFVDEGDRQFTSWLRTRDGRGLERNFERGEEKSQFIASAEEAGNPLPAKQN
jgi:hypothetical protein